MKLEIFPLGPIKANGYLLRNDKGNAVFFDPGGNPKSVLQYIEEKSITIQGILLTHAHFDHIGGLEELRRRTKAPVYIHENEADWLLNPDLNGSGNPFWRPFTPPIICQPAEVLVDREGMLTIGDFTFEVFHTPGHSPGSLSYYIDGMVICGDTLFQNGIGRTDLPGGDHRLLLESIEKKLFKLPDNTLVYPGHGEYTTIEMEKRTNPFLQWS